MSEFFNLDNKFFQGVNKVVDCFGLSILWLICCIPVFTAGAATTALYYTVNKVIRHGRSYVWKEFWHAFRSNFKTSTIVWLILVFAAAFLSMDCYIMYQYAKVGDKLGAMYFVFVVFIALLVMWANYLFPYMARFENGAKIVLKNGLFIAIANLPWTFVLFILFCAVAVIVWILPPAIFFIPALYMLLANLILERVFLKYMSEEDIAAEKERNEEFYN